MLALGEMGKSLPEKTSAFLVQERGHLVLLHPEGGMLMALGILIQGLMTGLSPIQMVEGLARGDGDEPRAEAGFKAESGKGAVDPQEGLLRHIIGILVVLEDRVNLAVDIALEALHQLAKGLLISFLSRCNPDLHLRGVVRGFAQQRPHAQLVSSLGYHLGPCGKWQGKGIRLLSVDPEGMPEVEWMPGGPMEKVKNQFDLLLSEEQIAARVRELGAQLTRDYEGKELLVVGVLSGVFPFLADLVRSLDLDVEISFMQLASYGANTVTTGEVAIKLDLDQSIHDRHVLVVEDIVDTGLTLHKVRNLLMDRQPASLKIATLLDKPSRRRVDVPVDYVGFVIEDHFVIGYGLDCAGRYRNLPYVGIYKP